MANSTSLRMIMVLSASLFNRNGIVIMPCDKVLFGIVIMPCDRLNINYL